MRLLFYISMFVQIALAVHAYRHGRTSPWVWIILFFPIVGSAVYVILFMSKGISMRPAPTPGLRDVRPGPFAKTGDRPDNAIVVSSPEFVDARVARNACPDCGDPLEIYERRKDTLAGRDLTVVVTHCTGCGAAPVRYFDVTPS